MKGRVETLMTGTLAGSELPGSTWVKSSLSFANGNCVEVSDLAGGTVGVRSSRDREGPVLLFTADEWHAFLGGVRKGEFDEFGKTRMLAAAALRHDKTALAAQPGQPAIAQHRLARALPGCAAEPSSLRPARGP